MEYFHFFESQVGILDTNFFPSLNLQEKRIFSLKMLGNMLRYIRGNIFSEQILQSGQSLILCPLCPVPELRSRILQYWQMRTGIMSPLSVFTFTFLELKLAMKMGIMSPHSVARKMEHFQKKILQCWQSEARITSPIDQK